jgi:quinol monooxygenase YgiN
VNGRCLFAYFRVAREHEAAALATLRELHAEWSASMQCELLRRADEHADPVTLMEVYRHPAGVTPETQRRIEQAVLQRLAPLLAGPRHVEVFEPCA